MIRLRLQLDSALVRLQGLADRLADVEALLGPAVPVVARALERNFDEEGRPVRWRPLTPRYARYKASLAPGLKILERTGRLRRSLQTRVEGHAIVASTDVPYAPFHQFGTRVLPARPFLVLTEADKEEVAQTIARSLKATGRRPQVTSRVP